MTQQMIETLLETLQHATPDEKGGLRKKIIAHYLQTNEIQRCERFMNETAQQDKNSADNTPFNTHSTEYLLTWAQVLNRLGRDIDAREKLVLAKNNASPQNKTNEQLSLELAKELLSLKAYRHSELWLNEVISMGNKTSNAYYHLANSLRLQHKLQPALEAINTCATIEPVHWDVHWTRAAIHLALEQHAACLEDCQAVLKQETQDATTWFRMGLCLEHLGNTEEALHAFNQSTQIDPYLFAAYTARIDIAIRLGKVDHANAALDEMVNHLEVSETVTQHWKQQIQGLQPAH
jgi:tetratricopeptide (TPR) repeat protein